jgi:Omp85 superfamily domain
MGLALLAAAAAVVLLAPATLPAQVPDTTAARDSAVSDTLPDESGLPREVAREVVDIYNAAGTLRVDGQLDIAPEREVDGDVAVLNGPVNIAGTVKGRVVAINADVALARTARVGGDLIVVGGIVEGRGSASVGGEIRVYRQILHYRAEGDRIVAVRGRPNEESGWWPSRRRYHGRTWSDLRFASARTYNRVEGLPINLGPSVRQTVPWGELSLDAFGVIRSVEYFHWDSENVGHNVRGEVRVGDRPGLALGGRLFDIVDPIEDWHLTDAEVGLASFFLHRDFRDYYNRHGGSGYLSMVTGQEASLTFSLSDVRWNTRRVRDPFTLVRNDQDWRDNPEVGAGPMHVANATLRIDTRNDPENPWSGWYIVADYEHGSGTLTGPALVDTAAGVAEQVTGHVGYGRGFLDLRRYNRVTPGAQLNLRVVLGGWLGGDPLPLQRRFSVGGPGTIPGFPFRRTFGDTDVNQCTTNATQTAFGVIALCERVALAQVEYRGDLRVDFNLFGRDENGGPRFGVHTDVAWVVFGDAGRGWLVGPREGTLQYESGQFPALGTFRTDLGAGLEVFPVGVYVAKSVSDAKLPANFYVRLRRRF